MRLFIIRHADPSLTQDTLTPAGHKEAVVLAEYLKKIGIDIIYSSPLKRTLETAKPTAKLLNIDINIQDWAKELDWWIDKSPWGKRSAWNTPGEVIREYGTYDLSPAIEEEFEELKKESDLFFECLGYKRVKGRYHPVRSNNQKVALFTHAGVGLALISHLLDIPLPLIWSGFFLDPSSVTLIHFEERSQQWAIPRCLSLGDISYLLQAGLKLQSSSIYKKFS